MRATNIPLGEWKDEAVCSFVDPSIFFPDDGNYGPAKQVCGQCPVRADCLEHSLEHEKQSDGVWGGKDPTERRLLVRARARAARKRRVA